jgi:hypothetical protein
MAYSLFVLVGFYFFPQPGPDPKFEPQVLDTNVAIGYGLAIGEVDGDGKPDILLADKKQFVWYRNGDWKRFVMVENLTEFDNVCIAARDIDGDGKVEVAVGAQWNPGETSDTLKSGSVHYLIRPKDPTQRWTPVELHHEPTIHRMKWVAIGRNKFRLIVVPLHGLGNKNGEGAGVKVIAYEVPKDPTQKWEYQVIDESMHLTHNFDVIPNVRGVESIAIAGKEGIKEFQFADGNWAEIKSNWITDRSFGEIRLLRGSGGEIFAGITPMHGNELAIHGKASRIVLTSDLNQGHALAVSDLLSSGKDQIVVGWREPNKENKVGIKILVSDAAGKTWKDYWVDEGGMACEDLQVADLDGDGKKDIIAAGRSSHNLKVYWNRNRKK